MFRKKKKPSVVVKINYGLFANNPHTGDINKAITKYTKQGYQLANRSEHIPPCSRIFVLSRAHTELTFILSDQ